MFLVSYSSSSLLKDFYPKTPVPKLPQEQNKIRMFRSLFDYSTVPPFLGCQVPLASIDAFTHQRSYSDPRWAQQDRCSMTLPVLCHMGVGVAMLLSQPSQLNTQPQLRGLWYLAICYANTNLD